MNKLKILALLPALVLCSCGAKKNKYAGTYQFRLGKTDGTHMEVTATLTDDNDEKVEGYKVMKLKADLGDQLDPMSTLEEIEDMLEEVLPVISDIVSEEIIEKLPQFVKELRNELATLSEIKFFYKVTDYKNEKYGNRVELGTHVLADILDSIKSKHPEFVDLINEGVDLLKQTGFFRDDMFFMPEISKYAFNAFIGKKGLTIQAPVSKDDLSQQFLWYGFTNEMLGASVDLPENYMERMPGVKGEERFGVHPERELRNNVVIKDEAAQVNKEFEYEFSKSFLYSTVDIMESSETARFVLDDSGETPKLYMRFADDAAKAAYSGSGYVGTIDRQLLTLDVGEDGLCDIEITDKTGTKRSFLDKNKKEFKFTDVISDPFEFRDFNVVNLGLAKVEA